MTIVRELDNAMSGQDPWLFSNSGRGVKLSVTSLPDGLTRRRPGKRRASLIGAMRWRHGHKFQGVLNSPVLVKFPAGFFRAAIWRFLLQRTMAVMVVKDQEP